MEVASRKATRYVHQAALLIFSAHQSQTLMSPQENILCLVSAEIHQ